MTAEELLSRLDGVRARGGGRWTARCPAHADRVPSLSIAEGERGILIHCFAACRKEDVVAALGLTLADLFYDVTPDPRARAAARRREQAAIAQRRGGLQADQLREAERVIRSARDIDIAEVSDELLSRYLEALARAHTLLHAEMGGERHAEFCTSLG